MDYIYETACRDLLLNVICHEMFCGRLSPEMEYLFQRHLKQCPGCRHRILALQRMLGEPTAMRNFG
jgi:DNA-directed RNA polymerase subunit RPC12/RpoP